jgi:hypothetical protein
MMVWMYFIVLIIMAVVLSIVMFPRADEFSRVLTGDFHWTDLSLNLIYGAAIIINLVLGTTSFAIYGKEIKKGTIQNLTLYPVSIIDLTISRLLSTAIIMMTGGLLVFFGAFMPFIALGVIPGPDTLLIFLTTYAITLFILTTGAFAVNILYYYSSSARITPSTFSELLFVPAILLARSVIFNIGFIILVVSQNLSTESLQDLAGLSGALSLLSPYHSGGCILGNTLGVTSQSADFYIFIPLFILLIIGFILGRKIYPDKFIRE